MKKYKILLLSGKAGSGKDTCANLLTNWHRLAFADALKDYASKHFKIPRTFFDTQEGKKQINAIGISNRELLIQIADKYRKEDPDFWARIVSNQIDKYNGNVVITDFRFPNEFNYLFGRHSGTHTLKTLRVERDACCKYNCQSETSLDNYTFDFKVNNNGSIDDIGKELNKIIFLNIN